MHVAIFIGEPFLRRQVPHELLVLAGSLRARRPLVIDRRYTDRGSAMSVHPH
jgi:hypothetical protein